MIVKRKTIQISICLIMALWIGAWPKVSLLDERSDVIKLKFEVPQYTIGSQVINGEYYSTVTAGSEPPTYEKGYPEVPYFTQSVLLGNHNAITLSIVSVTYKEITMKKLTPSRGPILRSEDPSKIPYTFSEVYSQDSWYPKNTATSTKPYIFRDLRGITVTFNPFQYNAQRGILRIAEEMVVSLKTVGVATENVLPANPKITSKAFANIYATKFINYTHHRFENDISDGDRMIIITADKYKGDLDAFVEWKNRKGIKTTVHVYPSETGSGSDKIKGFIKNQYTENKITYVLLVGNIKDVPGIKKGSYTADPPYSLVGSGIYPKVFTGRFCVDNNTELKTIINKSLDYEQNPDLEGSWYGNAICNGSKDQQSSPKPDWGWMKDFADLLKKGDYVKADVYSQGGAGGCTAGTPAKTSAAINKGITWFNYMGHGSSSSQSAPSFSSSNIKSLKNKGKYPVCISVACYNGQYNKKCIGQTWIVASDKGGIVYLGSYISQAWVPPQYGQQGMMSVISQKNFLSVGNIVNNGLVRFLDKYKKDQSNIFATWNYFGDPSIYLRNKKPVPIKLIHPNTLKKGKQTFEVDGPADAVICVYSKSQSIWETKALNNGKASFSIEVKNTLDSILLTGVGKNDVPYLGLINGGISSIAEIPSLTLTANTSIFFNSVSNHVIFNYPKKFSNVEISIYCINGDLVFKKSLNSGSMNVLNWNFTNNSGVKLAKGMYHASMTVKMDKHTVSKVNKTLIYCE